MVIIIHIVKKFYFSVYYVKFRFFNFFFLFTAVTNRIGYEEQIPGQLRDWNEELQSAKELPKRTRHQRTLRDRALYKVNQFYVFNFYYNKRCLIIITFTKKPTPLK